MCTGELCCVWWVIVFVIVNNESSPRALGIDDWEVRGGQGTGGSGRVLHVNSRINTCQERDFTRQIM